MRELTVAIDAARRAGAIQMDRYERLERITAKSDHDVVTEVDHLCEDLILDAIRGAFPEDETLAEEATAAAVAASAARKGGGRGRPSPPPPPTGHRVWIVDPLDGTVNYANGIPIFCVSVALAIAGRPAVGVIYDPVRDELFSAVAGGGAELDGVPIRQPVKEKLSDCVVSVSLGRGYASRARALARAIRVGRALGSASLSLAWVANGRFDAFVQPRGLSNWDVAAAGLIAEEAGARVTDGACAPWLDLARQSRDVGVVAAAPVHHTRIMELLATPPPRPRSDQPPLPERTRT